jgi:hypothetical protein
MRVRDAGRLEVSNKSLTTVQGPVPSRSGNGQQIAGRRFDLDHLCAQIAQLGHGRRAGDICRQ